MKIIKNIGPIAWIMCISFFTFLMITIVLPYLSWEWDVDFLQTKQKIVHLFHYRTAFYFHIFSSCFILFAGAFLFSKTILKNYSKLHRWSGRIYVLLLLFISAPTGMAMAFYANGGWPAKMSFLILCPLWWYCTYMGYRKIRQKNVKEHEMWMIRSYALTLSAISLRFYQMVLGNSYIDPATQYVIVSWVSWLGNLIVAEIFIRYKNRDGRDWKPVAGGRKRDLVVS